VTAEILDLVKEGNLDGAIARLRQMEQRAGQDNSQSVLMSAACNRFKHRIADKPQLPERIDNYRTQLVAQFRGAIANVERAGEFSDRSGIQHVLLLIHGIRTHADWFETVTRIFASESSCEVVPIRYKYFDLIKFISPVGRGAPVRLIRKQLQNARAKYARAKISVIAHSFGTYALMHAIRDNRDIEIFRIILCGSVVPETWDFEDYFITRGESTDIVNDCGVRDVWPVLARCCSWGYGASGTFGKAGVGVRDRKFPYSHSDFFQPLFISRYWVPFIEHGQIVLPDTEGVSMKPSGLVAVLSSPLLSNFLRLFIWTVIALLGVLLIYGLYFCTRDLFLWLTRHQ
jgi:hypothetical protein